MMARGLIVATQFLTRLPAPRLDAIEAGDLARSAAWFPFVGAVIGGLVAAAVWTGAHFGPWIGALCGLVVWIAITGALHLDGLGDVADALGAAHGSPDRFLEVVRDPHIGSFGVTAIVLQILAKLVLLAELARGSDVVALVFVAAWARWGVLVLGQAVAPLAEGLGARFAREIDWRTTAAWGVALALASAWLAAPLIGALAIVAALALFWRLRVGGMSGDCLGASIEVAETLLLVLLVTLSPLRI